MVIYVKMYEMVLSCKTFTKHFKMYEILDFAMG